MATTFTEYNGSAEGVDGSQTLFGFTFEYIDVSHIKVSINGIETTEYILANDTTIEFNTAPVDGSVVRIFRSTPSDSLSHEFFSGSAIKAKNLNENFEQSLFVVQETVRDVAESDVGSVISTVNIANTNSTLALSTAQNAESTANTISGTASNALTIAQNAETNANSALSQVNDKISVGSNVSLLVNDTNYITAAQVPSAFISGMVIMWSGSVSAIPTGWLLCDGTNSTPNLVDRFVVGAGSAYSVGDTGGSNSVSLSSDEMPRHRHSFSASNTHRHQQTEYSLSSTGGGGTGGRRLSETSANTSNTTITISGNTGYEGDGDAHENRPPYYAICFIMKS